MNVVSRKRVQARKDIIRRAQEKNVKESYNYAYKHTIVIDSIDTSVRPENEPETEAHDGTTYDINDIIRSEAEAFEFFREMKAREDVIAEEMRRANSGPAKALGTYLDKPTDERLKWLTKAVLAARGEDTGQWQRHAGAVEKAAADPANHPPGCGCGGCS